jgi:hypothetical protein
VSACQVWMSHREWSPAVRVKNRCLFFSAVFESRNGIEKHFAFGCPFKQLCLFQSHRSAIQCTLAMAFFASALVHFAEDGRRPKASDCPDGSSSPWQRARFTASHHRPCLKCFWRCARVLFFLRRRSFVCSRRSISSFVSFRRPRTMIFSPSASRLP